MSLNNYGNSVILNTHDNHNSSDAAAAGALINTFNGMAFTSLFAVTSSNYIKSIPMAIIKNYKEVRENLLGSALIGVFILTPIAEVAFYFSEELFEKMMHSPVNASQIASNYYRDLNQQACRKVMPTFLEILSELKQSEFKELASLGKTLGAWKDEVARMWRFSK